METLEVYGVVIRNSLGDYSVAQNATLLRKPIQQAKSMAIQISSI